MYGKPARAMIAMTMTGHDNDCHRKYSYRPQPCHSANAQAMPSRAMGIPSKAKPDHAVPSKGPARALIGPLRAFLAHA